MQPAISLHSRIAFIKQLKAGEYVGYGMHYKARADHKVAIIPLGYGDGFPRMRNCGEVLISGKLAPIIGGVAMDSMMVDLSMIDQAKVDDPVVLIGKQQTATITAYDLAQHAKTVVYEILTSWQPRLTKTYY